MSSPDDHIPVPAPGASFEAAGLDPLEAYVSSFIDGQRSVAMIAAAGGTVIPHVVDILQRLEAAGALQSKLRTGRRRRKSTAQRLNLDAAAINAVKSVPPPPIAPPVDPEAPVAEDVEDVEVLPDLSPELRGELDRLLPQLDELDHYALLGVSRDAEKAEIRTSYFAKSKRFHPDTLFGKELGSYKSKMETAFKAMTTAYETLSRKKRRAEYDTYLADRDAISGVTKALAKGAQEAKRISTDLTQLAKSVIEAPETPKAASTPNVSVASPPPSAPEKQVASPPPPAPKKPVASKLSPEQQRARARALLDRRMGRISRPKMAIPKAPSTPPKEAARSRDAVLGDLRSSLRRVGAVTGNNSEEARHLAKAKRAASAEKWVDAINAYKAALALKEHLPEALEGLKAAEKSLAIELAGSYERQAIYEEKQENWATAGRSWVKVAEGRPDNAACRERAILALLRAGGRSELKVARQAAMELIALGKTASRHVLLGKVYWAAGMSSSARREVDAALELSPGHEGAKELLGVIRAG